MMIKAQAGLNNEFAGYFPIILGEQTNCGVIIIFNPGAVGHFFRKMFTGKIDAGNQVIFLKPLQVGGFTEIGKLVGFHAKRIGFNMPVQPATGCFHAKSVLSIDLVFPNCIDRITENLILVKILMLAIGFLIQYQHIPAFPVFKYAVVSYRQHIGFIRINKNVRMNEQAFNMRNIAKAVFIYINLLLVVRTREKSVAQFVFPA